MIKPFKIELKKKTKILITVKEIPFEIVEEVENY
jgi:hypothetical protein